MSTFRVLTLIIPFVASSFIVVGITVWFISNNNILLASFVLLSWGAGQMVGGFCLVVPKLKHLSYNVKFGRILVLVIVANITIISLVSLKEEYFFIILINVFISGVCWIGFRVISKNISGSWGEKWLRVGGSTGRVGAAVGAIVNPLIVLSTNNLWIAGFLCLCILVSPVFIKSIKLDIPEGLADRKTVSFIPILDNAFLVLATYGFAATYVIIVSLLISVNWVVFFMPVYMLGALVASLVGVKVSRNFKKNVPMWLTIGIVSNVLWLALFVSPYFLIPVAFLSSFLLYIVEGSADWAAYIKQGTSELMLGRALGSVAVVFLITVIIALFEEDLFSLMFSYLIFGLAISCFYILFRKKVFGTLVA